MNKKYYIWILLAFGFFVRLLATRIDFSFESDVRTFQIWAMQLFEHGFSAFYVADSFTDYPPVYMYVLYLLGALRSLFDWQILSPVFNLLTFLPAIIFDLAIGFLLYKMAKGEKLGLFIAFLWVFNPAVILISGVWGQVESVFTFLLLLSLYFMQQKKLPVSYAIYGLAILTKPQSLFLGSVFLYYAYDYFKEGKSSKETIIYFAKSLAAGVGVMIVVSLPFGLLATFNQMIYGMDLYNFATVNAFNFWALIGANWTPLDNAFLGFSYGLVGILIVFVIICASIWALHLDKTKHKGQHFYLIVATLFIIIFVFSVKMHERYLFPGLLFLLVYYMENGKKAIKYFYLFFSTTFFINCVEILRWLRGGFTLDIIERSTPIISFINVVLAIGLLVYIAKKINMKNDSETFEILDLKQEEPLLVNPPKMSKVDYVFICFLIAVYSVLAFINLGDFNAPQTAWIPEPGEYAIINFSEPKEVHEIQFFMGARHNIAFDLQKSNDGGLSWELVHTVPSANVFAWTRTRLSTPVTAEIFRLIPLRNGLRLQEFVFRGGDGEVLEVYYASHNARQLFDEQSLIPEYRNFMNSTYFDEIYHPRTGYEFIHGLTVFETSHPPLGKVFIAASVRVFGMSPFAWRLPGTIFGILMIPLLYAFARKMFRSNNMGLFVAFIFTFDFMLFSQTRLATIDTYVTFFVLAMYYFMYLYVRGISSNNLKKSLILLSVCGAMMGLAIASKWQGVYGALGLPILFFPALNKLYDRDKFQAKATFLACFAIFIFLPLIIYSLSYIPFVRAYSGTEANSFLKIVWDNQVSMFNYHSGLIAEHPFASPWWQWPIMTRPLFQYQTVISSTVRQGMSSIGNPAVWWFGIFAAGYAIYRFAKSGFNLKGSNRDLVFLLIAYAAQFLPWALVTRLTFIYHYFPSVPFVVLIITFFFHKYVRQTHFKISYAIIVFALFILFFPVLSGMPVTVEFVDRFLRWLPGWVFI